MRNISLVGIFLAVIAVAIVYVLVSGSPAPSGGSTETQPDQNGLPPSEPAGGGQDAGSGQAQNQSGEMRLDYAVGGCDSHDEKGMPSRAPGEGINITVAGDMINVTHALVYVCCAEIEMGMEKKEENGRQLIILTERNTGEMCKCICEYSVNASIGPLVPGTYGVQLWGVAFQDSEPELLFEKEVEIG